jgi:hypothetical protein
MLRPFLLAASLLSAQQASMDCANLVTSTTQTQLLRGPAGMNAVLKVSSEDDHAKDSHQCMARYELIVVPAAGRAAVVADITSSDGDWGRRLSIQLDGFSRDGKRVFGILGEVAMLFDYDTTDRRVELIYLPKPFRPAMAAKCRTTFAVTGTTETGAIVLEQDPRKQCGANYRWMVDPATRRLQRLPQGKSIVNLYKYKVDAP